MQQQQPKKLTPIQRQQLKNQRPPRQPKKSKKQIQSEPQPEAPFKLNVQPQTHLQKQVVLASLAKINNNGTSTAITNQESINNTRSDVEVITEAELEQFVAQKDETPQQTILPFDENSIDTKEKVLEELKVSFIAKSMAIHKENEYHPIHTNPVDLTIVPEAADLIPSDNNENATEITEEFPFFSLKTTQEIQNSNNNDVPSELLQSVLLPTEPKGLGFFGNLSYYTRDPIAAIIAHLQDKTYDTSNKDHFDWLQKALEKIVINRDLTSLATITALCQQHEEYKNKIRISDTLAQHCSELYTTSISLANNKLEEKLAEYNTRTATFEKLLQDMKAKYENDMLALINKYGEEKNQTNEYIAGMKKELLTLSALNASIRKDAIQINIAKNQWSISNECEQQFEVAKISLNTLDKISKTMPRIKEPKLALIQNQLENK